jgi:hypothetical protein
MAKRKSPNTGLQRAALLAAAGIAASSVDTVAAPVENPNAAMTPPSAHVTLARRGLRSDNFIERLGVRLTSDGVRLHSDAWAHALRKDKAAAVVELRKAFPGLSADQVDVGSNGMLTLRTNRVAVLEGLAMMDNGVCGNNAGCNTGCGGLLVRMNEEGMNR